MKSLEAKQHGRKGSISIHILAKLFLFCSFIMVLCFYISVYATYFFFTCKMRSAFSKFNDLRITVEHILQVQLQRCIEHFSQVRALHKAEHL